MKVIARLGADEGHQVAGVVEFAAQAAAAGQVAAAPPGASRPYLQFGELRAHAVFGGAYAGEMRQPCTPRQNLAQRGRGAGLGGARQRQVTEQSCGARAYSADARCVNLSALRASWREKNSKLSGRLAWPSLHQQKFAIAIAASDGAVMPADHLQVMSAQGADALLHLGVQAGVAHDAAPLPTAGLRSSNCGLTSISRRPSGEQLAPGPPAPASADKGQVADDEFERAWMSSFSAPGSGRHRCQPAFGAPALVARSAREGFDLSSWRRCRRTRRRSCRRCASRRRELRAACRCRQAQLLAHAERFFATLLQRLGRGAFRPSTAMTRGSARRALNAAGLAHVHANHLRGAGLQQAVV